MIVTCQSGEKYYVNFRNSELEVPWRRAKLGQKIRLWTEECVECMNWKCVSHTVHLCLRSYELVLENTCL